MGDSFLQEFEVSDYKRQLNLMISELRELTVLLRLGRESCYVTVGMPQPYCCSQRSLTHGPEEAQRHRTVLGRA